MIFKSKKMLGAAMAVLVSGSSMAQSVDLSLKWKAEEEYSINQKIVIDMTMPNPQGGEMKTNMTMALGMKGPSSQDEQGTLVGLKMDTVSMKMMMGGNELMNYDSAKPNLENPMDKAMAPLMELNFKSLYGKDGKFIELRDFDEKLLNPEMGITKGSLEAMMKQQSQMIPHREVKVGEVWKAMIKMPMQGFEEGITCNYVFKLASLEEVEGRKMAKIEFNADMEKMQVKQNGIDMAMSAKNIEGHYLFDVEAGQFATSKAFFDMVAETQGIEMMMKMQMDMEFKNSPLKK